MHTTIAYSRRQIDWTHPVFQTNGAELVSAGGDRVIEYLDQGALVLRFTEPSLGKRWRELCQAGASWDFESFLPHITISKAPDVDAENILPFQGSLTFGPEYRKIAK
ncbi:hypothetical protein [Leisingera caerulea]|uniref:hypothetical protein n=1 Tax=Leisingera caerulea TaxID=506591 RepID=UPI0040563FE7